jgi:threonine aldolase
VAWVSSIALFAPFLIYLHCTFFDGSTGIHTRQVEEDKHSAELLEDDILDCVRNGFDDHWPITSLLCLENSHNMCGGVALPKDYFDRMGKLAHGDKMNHVNVHVDGARIFNAAVALDTKVKDLCENVDSVSVCLSKGLGAPLGSVLVGGDHFIEVAKRARKRCGGGMRQAGVVASMGLYAVQNNIERLAEDHARAKKVRKTDHMKIVVYGFGAFVD